MHDAENTRYSDEKRISLCLVTYNEAQHLPLFFTSLSEQSSFSSLVEIVVVDNGSTDDSINIVKEFTSNYPIPLCLLNNSENNLGLARRLAISSAKGELVLFCDPDCQFETHWIQTLLTAWNSLEKRHQDLAGVGGGNRLPENTSFEKAINIMLSSYLGHGRSPQAWIPDRPTSVGHLATTNALFSRKVILDAGNFSPLFSSVCEDVDLGIRISKQGNRLFLLDSTPVLNACATTFTQWARRMFRFSLGQRLIYQRHNIPKSHASLISKTLLLVLSITLLLSPWEPRLLLLPLSYLTTIGLYSLWISISKKKPLLWPWVLLALLFTHLAYGWGSWYGLKLKE